MADIQFADEQIASNAKQKSDPARINFSAFTLRNLEAPTSPAPDKIIQKDYWDISTPGFGLRISSTGARSWVLLARVLRGGVKKVARVTIGKYAERDDDPRGMTLAVARARAHDLRLMVAKGEDPALAKQHSERAKVAASRDTLGAVIDDFLKRYPKSKKLRPATMRQYHYILRGKDFDALRSRSIASITRREVNTFLDEIQDRGVTVTANRALAALRKVMHWAIQRGIIESTPTDHIEPPIAYVPRQRHLFGDVTRKRPNEMALAWRAVAAVGTFGALPMLLMLLGQRLGETSGMRDDELIDLDGAAPMWRLPGARTKNGKEHTIPLGPLAVSIIKAIPCIEESPFVISPTGVRPFTAISHLKRDVDKQIALLSADDPRQYAGQFAEHWTLHDLRRTFKTGLAELGVSGEIRDALMNHSRLGMDTVYNHAQYAAAKRTAVLQWERYISELLDPAKSEKIVLIRAA